MRLELGLSLVVVGMLSAGEAKAVPGRDVEVTYYAERTLMTEVGSFMKPCGTGHATLRGRRTPYYVRSQSTCPSGSHLPPTTISCHFTEAGCSDDIARMMPKPHKRAKRPKTAPRS